MIFGQNYPQPDKWRRAIYEAYRLEESQCVNHLLEASALSSEASQRIDAQASTLIETIRSAQAKQGALDALLHQYDLSSQEGIALMCLAEAMLRIPDTKTVDRLIQDKLAIADWSGHKGKSNSFLVNAATWGLLLTGKLIRPSDVDSTALASSFKRVISRLGEPVVRRAVAEGMKRLGQHFVMGTTIEQALTRAKEHEAKGYRYSYDMLGEAARTADDAEQYYQAYKTTIETLGKQTGSTNLYERPGVSIKLSALHPRYEWAKYNDVVPSLTEKLRALVGLACQGSVTVTIDAEESDRLDLSLDIIEALLTDPQFKDWPGFGLAVQAYQKRAPAVIDWLIDRAQQQKRCCMVRLVKGAYWDTEIKQAQVLGLADYPVFTRKAFTDLSFVVCAKKMIAAKGWIYSQFGTHNARSVATVLELMGRRRDFEFQCLHGMGTPLYDTIVDPKKRGIPCRVYAPVGSYQDLLPYLVRRLLENGANTSFVNRVVDKHIPIDHLVADPSIEAIECEGKPHPRLPLPVSIYQALGETRPNSRGIDFSDRLVCENLAQKIKAAKDQAWTAEPLIASVPFHGTRKGKQKPARKSRAGSSAASSGQWADVHSPSDHSHVVGRVKASASAEVEQATQVAHDSVFAWNAVPVEQRAQYLDTAADLLEANKATLFYLLIHEAGKTLPDAISEVREAADFCRYYAMIARQQLTPRQLPGPTGEDNRLLMQGRGTALCISPWNFPLAIFTGQIVAALVAGNTVLAKPAQQTALVAAQAVKLLHQAGIPPSVLQLLPGPSKIVSRPLVADTRVSAILLTGSTETAQAINQVLAARSGPIIPLIAETGGQNALIADSTALPEQLVADVITSAFGSAGQRCSALRVLFIQEAIADKVINMLKGAMAEIKLGYPGHFSTDVGPVIDEASKKVLQDHIHYLKEKQATLIYSVPLPDQPNKHTFFPPQAYEIDALSLLKGEVFGPILHVIRYGEGDLDAVIESINQTGFGLTLGIHSRLQPTIDYIQQRVNVGNTYVNRTIIGAVVGVQPFGGEGLSGTGPKAGGPHYLMRLCKERTVTVNTTAVGGNASLLTL